MKRLSVILLLLIANAIVSSSRDYLAEEPAPEAKVAQTSSLHWAEDYKLEGCTTL